MLVAFFTVGFQLFPRVFSRFFSTTILKFQFELELDHFTRFIRDIRSAYCVGTVILKVLYSMGIKQTRGIL